MAGLPLYAGLCPFPTTPALVRAYGTNPRQHTGLSYRPRRCCLLWSPAAALRRRRDCTGRALAVSVALPRVQPVLRLDPAAPPRRWLPYPHLQFRQHLQLWATLALSSPWRQCAPYKL